MDAMAAYGLWARAALGQQNYDRAGKCAEEALKKPGLERVLGMSELGKFNNPVTVACLAIDIAVRLEVDTVLIDFQKVAACVSGIVVWCVDIIQSFVIAFSYKGDSFCKCRDMPSVRADSLIVLNIDIQSPGWSGSSECNVI